ncbi:MAG: dihydrolipoamide acetyltransferase family protein [Acidimicrobiia bacterium]|nr:dihydrolipoamide acetyltransferase family protein [Acidimicrobiia bacterium]
MAREFLLPDIGEGLTEADIVQWLVAEGETVEADQPIVEVETDKAVVEIPSPWAGTVLSHGAAEGDTLEVGSVLVVIGDESEMEASAPAAPTREAPPIVGSLSEEAEDLGMPPPQRERTPSGAKALPLVRKMARELGIDLDEIAGSGPDGRITREDVEAAAAAEPEITLSTVWDDETAPVAPPATPDLTSVEKPAKERAAPATREDRRTPMTRVRRTIAANMSRSWSEIPHVTTFDDVDATRLLEVRSALADRHGIKIPMEALVVKAVLPGLEAHPEFNATVDGDHLIYRGRRDIGIAVDTPEGLMVAVVANADRLGVLELASEIARLGAGARGRTLTPDELSGQTFTVTNIGAVGGGHGTPIVPPGTTAILSVGRAQDKPIVFGNDLAIAPVMPLSLSYDHRVIDGATGRRFMALVIENLTEPALFLAN